MAYKATVRPTLEYAATVWDPHTTQHINSIEMVQRRAARFVVKNYHDYSPGTVTNILEDRQWETLQARRSKARLTMLYKIIHGDVAIPSDSYITSGDARTRGAHRLREIPSPKDIYKFSLFPRTVRQWNHLPAEVATATTVDGFKVMLGRLPADHRALFWTPRPWLAVLSIFNLLIVHMRILTATAMHLSWLSSLKSPAQYPEEEEEEKKTSALSFSPIELN